MVCNSETGRGTTGAVSGKSSPDDADLPRINASAVHIDFMIGSDQVSVTGTTKSGDRVPVLRGGSWQI